MEYYVGVDLGTSSVKFVVLDESLKEVYALSRDLRIGFASDGSVLYDPEAVLRTVEGELRALSSKLGGDLYVGFSGHSPSLVVMDEQGRSLETIVWLDTRASSVLDEAAKLMGEKEWYYKTGLRLSPIFFPAKILWIKRFKPSVLERARWVAQFKDYVVYNLTKQAYTDYSSASETQLFNIRGFYDDEILGLLGLDESKLFEPAASHTVLQHASNPRIWLVLGGVDSVVAALGGGVVESSTASLSAGSSACVDIPVARPVLDYEKGFETYYHVLPGWFVLEASLPSAGLTVDKVLELAGLERGVEEEVGLDKPSGLVLVPYLTGSRSPDWDSSARGLVYGLSLSTTRLDLLKAAYEGIGFWAREVLELSRGLGLEVRQVVVSGGLSSSNLFNTITSSILGLEVKRPRVRDLSPYGAALLAAIGAGKIKFSDVPRLVEFEQVYSPRPELVVAYNALFQVYRKMKRVYKELGGIVG
ncbi:xylulokinase [Thermogladius sp.]|uniref:xylulokinase n=1 Tax=Thermogladius sp. TaxID=2023064 RepID=UPI003D12D0E6